MLNNETTIKTITRENIIKDIAKKFQQCDIDTVRMIYDVLEDKIRQYLSMANSEQNVKIKLFEGISIQGEYIQEQTKVNNLNGKAMLVSSRIKPKVYVTRTYCDKLNNKR